MHWILSAFTDEAGESSEEQVTACQRTGLKYLDLRHVDGHNITALPVSAALELARYLDMAGVTVHMYGSPIGKIDITEDFQTDLDRLEHLARMRDVFGANAVRIFSYYNRTVKDKQTWRRESLDRLKRLRDRAGQLGLVLYHENESEIFGDHPEDVALIAELREPETFRLIYDFANYLRTSVPPMTCWEMFRDRTDCFHFKDQRRDGQHVPMGQGDTEAEAIIRDAISRGWSGSCVVEPHLTHSEAVVATGVHGTGDASLASLSPADSFAVAVKAAKDLIHTIDPALRVE
ncbi:MAG: sugar phosphate isomerase/epimerase [Phycisphaeraceae bacterium]